MKVTCKRCGKPLYDGYAYCVYCGAPSETGKPSAGRQSDRTPAILAATAFVLAVVLVLGLWRPGFLWGLKERWDWPPSLGVSVGTVEEDTELAGLSAEEQVYKPATVPVSGTPALSVSPADGITISAEKNALDRERTFTAEPLTESEMGTLFFNRSYGAWTPVFAFEFDAGLQDDERLPGKLKVDLDLSKLGVEESLWPYLQVIRLGDDGTVMELPVSVTGKGISFETRQNCVEAITVGLAIGIPVMAYIERGQDGLRELYPNGIFYEAVSTELTKAKAQYHVTYPKSMARTDSSELKALDDRMRALIVRYGLNPDIPLLDAAMEACEALSTNPEYQGVDIQGAAYRLMRKIVNDPEYLSIQATFNDPEWQQKNLWPDSVHNTVKALKDADDYLYGEREFRVPTHVIDVLVLDRWPHGAETLGVSKNLYTASPYIHINAAKTADKQSLLLTLTHELFHVTQSGYVYFDDNNYLPFWEATAVLLEKEAFDYYVGEKEITAGRTDILTQRIHWEHYGKALMTPSEWEDFADIKQFMQDQGYAASYWIEFLQKRYNPGKDFLPQLLERFASTIGNLDTDVHKVLRDQTSSDSTAYCNDFRLFCIQNYANFNNRSMYVLPKLAVETLDADFSYKKVEMPYQAFSTRIRDIKIDSANDEGNIQKYKILIKGNAPGLVTPTIRFYQDGDFKVNLVGDNMTMLPESTGKYLTIHEIEDYFMTTPGTTAGTGYEYELWLMLPPEAPDVEIDEEEGVMLVTPGEFNLGSDVSAGYDVVVITPEGDEFHFPQNVYEDEAEIALGELTSDRKKSDEKENPQYIVYIVERVEFPDGSMQYGPDGERTELDDELRFKDILGTYDMTQTVSGFDSHYLDALVGQMEGVEGAEEYLEQYKQVMGNVDGTYTGTMVISEYQTGGQIADVTFIPAGSETGTTYYRGTWNKGVLHLEPVGVILGGSWDLTFTKANANVTCEGKSDYLSDMASYSYTMTATKQN